MAVEFILARDSSGTSKKIAVDRVTIGPDTIEQQIFKVGYGSDDATITLVADASRLPVAPVTRFTYTSKSGTITTGGTAQTPIASNSARNAWYILNPPSATETLWIRMTGAASAGGTDCIPLEPGEDWSENGLGVTTQAISVFAATTGHAFVALEA